MLVDLGLEVIRVGAGLVAWPIQVTSVLPSSALATYFLWQQSWRKFGDGGPNREQAKQRMLRLADTADVVMTFRPGAMERSWA